MRRKLMIVSLALVLLPAFWFLGVDLSWFVEDCPDCRIGRDIGQYRVFSISVHQQTRESDTAIHQVAADLGTPCNHPHLERRHKHRWWGLLICARPCINGIHRVSEGKWWYDDRAAAIVKDMAQTDPTLRGEFAQRVLKDHDWGYFRAMCDRVKIARDGQPTTAPAD